MWLLHQHRAHRHGAVGEALGAGDQVGDDAELLGAKAEPRRPKPVITSSKISRMPCLVADLAQPLEVALGGHQHAGGAGDRLDDDGGDVLASCSATRRSSSSASSAPSSSGKALG
jgi:hypothetical protein